MQAIKEGPNVPKPVGPYSPAVISNGLVFCSGQIGLDPQSGKIISDSVEDQTRQVMKNLDAVLKASGSSLDKVVMTTIFLTDMADGKVVSPIYGEFINGDTPPARQTVAVKALPLDVKVEISVIATK